MMFEGIKCEIQLADQWNWGYIQWLRTGPGTANTYIMEFCSASRSPYRAKGGYWWRGDECLAIQTEQQLFEMLGMEYIAPPAAPCRSVYEAA